MPRPYDCSNRSQLIILILYQLINIFLIIIVLFLLILEISCSKQIACKDIDQECEFDIDCCLENCNLSFWSFKRYCSYKKSHLDILLSVFKTKKGRHLLIVYLLYNIFTVLSINESCKKGFSMVSSFLLWERRIKRLSFKMKEREMRKLNFFLENEHNFSLSDYSTFQIMN